MQMEDFMVHNFNITRANCLILKGCSKNSFNRTRAEHGLIFYPEGGYTFHFHTGQTLRTAKNTILFIPKSAIYDIEAIESHDCISFTFDLSEPFDFEPFAMTVKHSGFFLDTYRDAEKICRLAQSGYQMNCKARLCAVIGALQKEYGLGYISGNNYSTIVPAIEKIHQTYMGNVPSVSELASLCEISPEYFRMLFKKKYGISPIKYINTLRLSHAKELLCSGMYSVTEVSSLCGFASISYFCREFKKSYGVSPSVFREDDGNPD